MSSSGSEQARTFSVGLTQNPLSRMVRSVASISPSLRLNRGAADDFFILRINIPTHAKLRVRLQDGHQKYLRRRSLRTQQGGNQDVGVEDNPNHCSRGCWRLRRAFRAASISASISSIESRSSPSRFALSQDFWSHSGADTDAIVRTLIASSSATERPSRLSIAIFWSGERSFAL